MVTSSLSDRSSPVPFDNEKAPLDQPFEVVLDRGTRYIVVDCGGGTVDITVHELDNQLGTLKELYKATGGPYGSVGKKPRIRTIDTRTLFLISDSQVWIKNSRNYSINCSAKI